MARRRRNNPGSSLDLFLDTICNAFGGIIFLSILIALLLQAKSTTNVDPSHRKVGTSDLEILQTQIEMLSLERTQLLASVNFLEDRFEETTGKNKDLIPKLKTLDGLRQSIAVTEQSRSALASELVQTARSMDDLNSEMKTLEDDLSRLRMQVNIAETELQRKLDTAERPLTIPITKATGKGNVLLAMRFGKVYLISGTSRYLGFNESHVDLIMQAGSRSIRPKPSAGWSVEDGQFSVLLSEALEGRSKDDFFLTIAVWQDSYNQFAEVKRFAIEKGYEYDLLPLSNEESIGIGAGENPLVQ